MTEAEILFNYSQAMAQAARLETAARSLERLSDRDMVAVAGTLRGVWNSDSSGLYLTKLGKVQGDIKSTADSLKRTAESIKEKARIMRRAEMEAIAIASQSSGGGAGAGGSGGGGGSSW